MDSRCSVDFSFIGVDFIVVVDQRYCVSLSNLYNLVYL